MLMTANNKAIYPSEVVFVVSDQPIRERRGEKKRERKPARQARYVADYQFLQ
jgi:hypothetical protein